MKSIQLYCNLISKINSCEKSKYSADSNLNELTLSCPAVSHILNLKAWSPTIIIFVIKAALQKKSNENLRKVIIWQGWANKNTSHFLYGSPKGDFLVYQGGWKDCILVLTEIITVQKHFLSLLHDWAEP